jgi:WD40 repeat protein
MRIVYLTIILLASLAFAQGQTANLKTELVVQTGHSAAITAVTFSSDSTLVASGGMDHTIKIWDSKTGVQVRTLAGHARNVNSIAFSPNGRLLVSGSDDIPTPIRVWEVFTGNTLYLLPHPNQVKSVAINSTGTILATGDIRGALVLWDLKLGQRISAWAAHGGKVSGLAFSPDGRILASASSDKMITLWDPSNGNLIASLPAGIALSSIAFSPDGRLVAAGGSYSEIGIWDIATHQRLKTINAGYESVSSLAFSSDSRTLASGAVLSIRQDNGIPRTVRLWNVETGEELSEFASLIQERSAYSLALSPDGKTLAIGGDSDVISLIDVTEARERLVLRGHSAAINSIAFDPNGKFLLVAGNVSAIKKWGTGPGGVPGDTQSRRSQGLCKGDRSFTD